MIYLTYSRSLGEEEKRRFSKVGAEIKSVELYFPELAHEEICIYFYSKDSIRGAPAEFIPLDHPQYNSRIKHINNPTKYSIVFSKWMTSCDNRIERILIISHEFQHVFQYIGHKKGYLYACILRDYGDDGHGMAVQTIPSEKDADRKSKDILAKMFGEEGVREFVNDLISSENLKDRNFADYFDSLNMEEEYDFVNEVNKLWDKKAMNSVIEGMKKSPTRLQNLILQNHNFAEEVI